MVFLEWTLWKEKNEFRKKKKSGKKWKLWSIYVWNGKHSIGFHKNSSNLFNLNSNGLKERVYREQSRSRKSELANCPTLLQRISSNWERQRSRCWLAVEILSTGEIPSTRKISVGSHTSAGGRTRCYQGHRMLCRVIRRAERHAPTRAAASY